MSDIDEAKVEFAEEILRLMLYCGEGHTDNCDQELAPDMVTTIWFQNGSWMAHTIEKEQTDE